MIDEIWMSYGPYDMVHAIWRDIILTEPISYLKPFNYMMLGITASFKVVLENEFINWLYSGQCMNHILYLAY